MEGNMSQVLRTIRNERFRSVLTRALEVLWSWVQKFSFRQSDDFHNFSNCRGQTPPERDIRHLWPFTINIQADIFSRGWRRAVLRYQKEAGHFHFGSVFERIFSFEEGGDSKIEMPGGTLIANDPLSSEGIQHQTLARRKVSQRGTFDMVINTNGQTHWYKF